MIEINPQFQKAFELINSGISNLFITGRAGTGKSTFLEYLQQNTENPPVMLAPTGVAALNVKGQTIHSFFNFPVDVTVQKIKQKEITPKDKSVYKKLKIIVIDEISMARADLLDCIHAFLELYGPKKNQLFGGVQMVFVGDLYQLPPVVSKEERELFQSYYETPYFYSAQSLKNAKFEIVELEKIYRQKDVQFVELLNKIRNNSVEKSDLEYLNTRLGKECEEDKHYISLTTTNKKSDEINNEHLLNLEEELYTEEAIITGNFTREYFPTAISLQFKVGSQVMLLNNDQQKRWVNGSIGIIEEVGFDKENEQYVEIKLNHSGRFVKIYPYTWEVFKFSLKENKMHSESVGTFTQYPFRLAWAITIHKSQGKTFDNVVVDIDRGTFVAGQMYVALSRCTSFEGLILKKIIKKSNIRVDYRVSKFLTNYHYQRALEELPIEKKTKIINKAIKNDSKLKMVYLKNNDIKEERTIVPFFIGEHEYKGKTFPGISAYCLDRKAERVFHVERIIGIEIIE